jgi:hypothetical protein
MAAPTPEVLTCPTGGPATALIQAKLTVGPADDRYEREADEMAKTVMRAMQTTLPAGPDLPAGPATRVQRRVQRVAAPRTIGLEGGDVDADTSTRIQRARGGGAPLDASVRRSMEHGFGADFSRIRVHTDSAANELNGRIQAKAFTTGSDIFFSEGTYQPGTTQGQELVAHELTHTIQQGGAARVQRSTLVSRSISTDPEERIRRRLAFTANDLGGSLTKKAKVKRFFGSESTYSKIEKALAAYEAAQGWGEQLQVLNTLKDLATTWLADHGADGKDAKTTSITNLLAKVNLETPIATKGIQDDADEQAAYVDAAKGGGGLKYLSAGGKRIAKKAERWKDAINLLGNQDLAANKLIAEYGLTLAEAMSLGIYTADDYKYINPAMADDDGWMQAMLPRLNADNQAVAQQLNKQVSPQNLAEAKIEGQLHGKIAMAGMKKLPSYKGDTFRGVGLTAAQFAQQYPLNGQAIFTSFSSTSLNEATSRGFASNNSAPPKLGILLRMKCTSGKEIAMLSDAPGEREILLMPGATFAVTKISDDEHRGKAIKVVDLKQVS